MENSEFDQSTPEFDQNASEKISEVFFSEFSVLDMVQNGKLGGEKPRKNILRGFRDFQEPRVFDLARISCLVEMQGGSQLHLCWTFFFLDESYQVLLQRGSGRLNHFASP